MFKRLKSKTNIGALAMFVQMYPGLADPLWAQLLIAGVSPQVVAIAKLVGMFGALALTFYGREKATDWQK